MLELHEDAFRILHATLRCKKKIIINDVIPYEAISLSSVMSTVDQTVNRSCAWPK